MLSGEHSVSEEKWYNAWFTNMTPPQLEMVQFRIGMSPRAMSLHILYVS